MLDVKDLTLHYGKSQILNEVSFQAKVGEITCIMGANGVGKTSLLRAISGAHPRSGGSVSLDDVSIGTLPAHKLAQMGIGYVPQGRDIFPLLTVLENLRIGFACLPRSEHHIPDEIYELFPVLSDMASRRGGDLSGGQQQQLAIARALITKPRCLLLDEPTEGIQPNIIQHIGEVIGRLRARGDMAIILVEQFFEFAHELGDQFVVMRRGVVTANARKHGIDKTELLNLVSI
jgi:urea transport system ATP-binding protein